MSEMREKLLAHIRGVGINHDREVYDADEVLDAILAELEKPDEAMIDAGCDATEVTSVQVESGFTAMIRAIREKTLA